MTINNISFTPSIGVSGISVFLPRFRVPLKEWCRWTGNSWEKVQAIVGRSFRVAGPRESIYTMAADAALRLILKYDVDPQNIGFIGLGTESSTDNSAGAVIVKGMLDQALMSMGLPRISRECEVPEFKHACLGGVYAMKGALRYLATDGQGRQAIVISADLAEYERGSTGEQTQGAGAVAQLLEENPKLYEIDFRNASSSSAYRGFDFRKPHRRHLNADLPRDVLRFPDYPIFNGKYSTICYTDQALHAVGRLIQKLGTNARAMFHEVRGAFFHRPYHLLPVNVLAALYVWGLTLDEEHLPELEELCKGAGADMSKMLVEARSNPDLFDGVLDGRINHEVYPEAMKVVKYFRSTVKFKDVKNRKLDLGLDLMKELGNLYTGSLPAWIAAGIEDALDRGEDLKGCIFLTMGYGSGDAAEAMLIRIVDGWQTNAAKIGFARSLWGAVDLKKEEYEALHDCLESPCPPYRPSGRFVVNHIGNHSNGFEDLGIEYYDFIEPLEEEDAPESDESPKNRVSYC